MEGVRPQNTFGCPKRIDSKRPLEFSVSFVFPHILSRTQKVIASYFQDRANEVGLPNGSVCVCVCQHKQK